jgi:ATP-dependent Clp protease ATP-binding subunit ClpA
MGADLIRFRPRTVRRSHQGDDLYAEIAARVIGQPEAIDAIVPWVRMYQAGLAPEGRPAGIFLLLGPTGTGKTRTVEAMAEALHGSSRNLLRIDCGEYQMEHEVSKLIGAPPGYLGHRETQALLTQARLASVASEHSGLSIVLFDEIEKAAASMHRMLLGILDKATLRLGDNNIVNFERTLIFLTSNLGARGIQKAAAPAFGFGRSITDDAGTVHVRMARAADAAARRRFAPEFMNRLDAVITYQPLSAKTLRTILDQQIAILQDQIRDRLGPRAFRLHVSEQSRQFLLRVGTSADYGAREIRRTLHRYITQPLADLVAAGKVPPGSSVQAAPRGEALVMRVAA